MCSICGGNLSADIIKKASDTMLYRGPDASGIFEDGYVSLAHNRLSIIDLSHGADQPFVSERYVLAFNGEIYNYKEIIQKYNLKCLTKSDTEVVLRLFEKLGVKALDEFNGMFSMAIYDKKEKKLFLARDRFGKKPFYYFFDDNMFVFASEIKAILSAINCSSAINKDAFLDYLSFLTPLGSKTFYHNIYKLEAGHCATFDVCERKLSIFKYYELSSAISSFDIDERGAIVDIERLLLESVNYRLVSDVPVASFLSGGLDSTLISALYSSTSSRKIDTFSIGYDDHKQYDELKYAKMASSFIGSNHHEIVASKQDFIDAFESILEIMDEPINDPAIIPTFMLSKDVYESGYKVVLSGEGSDEIFFGYDAYFEHLKVDGVCGELSDKSKAFLLEYHVKNSINDKMWTYLKRAYSQDIPIFRTFGECFRDTQKKELLGVGFGGADESERYFKELYKYSSSLEYSQWISYIDIKHWIGEVLMTKMDRMSMAHSLESRAPFLDYRLVEYVMSLPSSVRVGATTKSLLKEIAVKHIPSEIVYRQKKGFSSPHFEWYYETYKDKILEDLRAVNAELGWFNDDFLTFLYKEGKIGKFKQHLWGLIVFSRWFMKRFM